MKNVLFHHSYLTEDLGTWSSILLEQLSLIETTNLVDNLDHARFVAIGKKYQFEIFSDICNHFFPNKNNIEFAESSFANEAEMIDHTMKIDSHNDRMSENYTMKKIAEYCNQETDVNILYIHMKGVTLNEKYLKNKMNYRPDLAKVYHYWRKYIQWGVIKNWQLCTEALKNYDIAGCNFFMSPAPHFSGGFWWATCRHINRLPPIESSEWFLSLKNSSPDDNFKNWTGDRMKAEMWPCSDSNTRVFSVHSPPDHIVHTRPYYPFEYEGKQNSLDTL